MNEKIIDGTKVSLERKEELLTKISLLKKKLTLVDISVGNDKATLVYVKQKEKMAKALGYDFFNLHFDYIEEENLLKEITKLNNNQAITGIIVQLPLPNYLNKDKIINQINPLKDVDGLTNQNVLNLLKNAKALIPCTPKGIMTLLNYYQVNLLNKKVVIVGRSNLVGMPLFHLLINQNATVTLCHSKTKNLEEYTKQADILIVAVGKSQLIKEDMVKEGVIIIDVGINLNEGKLVGDCQKECLKKASLMTKVPGGVGPMTVISLMENVYLANQLQEKELN